MEQTRGNYYTMLGLGMALIAASAAVAVWLPPVFRTLVPVHPDRQGLHDIIMITLVMSAIIGGLRLALTIQAHWLPRCEMSEEQRLKIEKYTLPCRGTLDRFVMWMAVGCVVAVLFNYF